MGSKDSIGSNLTIAPPSQNIRKKEELYYHAKQNLGRILNKQSLKPTCSPAAQLLETQLAIDDSRVS
jgi:hypothetical protein